MHRSVRAAIWTTAVLLLVVESDAQSLPGPLRIAIIGKSVANATFLVARRGAEAAAQEESAKLGVPIEIVWLTPPREDAAAQAEHIAQAVREHMGAIGIACSDSASSPPRSTPPSSTAWP